MAVTLGWAFSETTQCVQGIDCWLFPCGGWEFIWPERGICSREWLRNCFIFFFFFLFLLREEPLWQLLSGTYLLPFHLKENKNSQQKKNIVKYRLSFFFPTSGQFPNPNQSADFKEVQYFPPAPFLPSRESNSSAQLAVLWDRSLLLSF